jgi:hypothetical protein
MRGGGTLGAGSKFHPGGVSGKAFMQDPATYKRYAEECRRMAMTAPEEHRRTLLEIADAWIRVAQDVERKKPAAEQQ